MGAGGGEHEQRAEGDEEQDQGEQEEIHGVYDFLKIFSSNINFVILSEENVSLVLKNLGQHCQIIWSSQRLSNEIERRGINRVNSTD